MTSTIPDADDDVGAVSLRSSFGVGDGAVGTIKVAASVDHPAVDSVAALVEASADSAEEEEDLVVAEPVGDGSRHPIFSQNDMSNTRISRLYKFLEEDPHDPFVRFALATEYRKIGEVESALQWFEKLVEDFPDYVGTYFHLGKLYSDLGRMTEARETFSRGIETASSIHDFHAISELRSAKMELEESLDELV